MFGIMGTDAAFAQAACAKKKEILDILQFKCGVADPNIYQVSCIGTINVISEKNGEIVEATYTDLNDSQLSISADADTNIKIIGTVVKFNAMYYSNPQLKEINLLESKNITYIGVPNATNLSSLDLSANTALTDLYCFGCTGLTALDLSANIALTNLECGYTGITALDLSDNTELTSLNCNSCTGLTALDLSANTALSSLNCNGCTGLTALDFSTNTALTSLSCENCDGLISIKYPATNDDVSTAVADAITNATAADGTVYTDSAAAYYSTISTAATAKGWTIEQL